MTHWSIQYQLNLYPISFQLPPNVNWFSIQYQLNLHSISNQFPPNFKSISTQFQINFHPISLHLESNIHFIFIQHLLNVNAILTNFISVLCPFTNQSQMKILPIFCEMSYRSLGYILTLSPRLSSVHREHWWREHWWYSWSVVTISIWGSLITVWGCRISIQILKGWSLLKKSTLKVLLDTHFWHATTNS